MNQTNTEALGASVATGGLTAAKIATMTGLIHSGAAVVTDIGGAVVTLLTVLWWIRIWLKKDPK